LTAFLHRIPIHQARDSVDSVVIAVGSGVHGRRNDGEANKKIFDCRRLNGFIYAVICEELGFIGAMIVIALFVVYGWRGMRAASEIAGRIRAAAGAGQ